MRGMAQCWRDECFEGVLAVGLGRWGCGIGRERVHVWGIGTYAEKSCSLARVVPGCCGGLYDRCTPVHGGDGCVGRYGHEQAVQGVG